MNNKIKQIPLTKLIPHPANPNKMSKQNFAKLVTHIKSSGIYEPLIVRAHPSKKGYFQIINGQHRYEALKQLGYKTADCIIWDVDDTHTLLLLATLNRLTGKDAPDKKIELLKKLANHSNLKTLSKLLPLTKNQIDKLINLNKKKLKLVPLDSNLPKPMVFFVTDAQSQVIESALATASIQTPQKTMPRSAQKRSACLTAIAQYFLDHIQTEQARVRPKRGQTGASE